MEKTIKSNAAEIAAKIEPIAGSATILKTALLAVAGHPATSACPAYAGHISEEELLKIIRGIIPEESTSEKWREYKLDADINRRKVVYNNLACGCEIWVEYFVGNTQYITAAGFITMFGKGREYRCVDAAVETFRLRHMVEMVC